PATRSCGWSGTLTFSASRHLSDARREIGFTISGAISATGFTDGLCPRRDRDRAKLSLLRTETTIWERQRQVWKASSPANLKFVTSTGIRASSATAGITFI